MIQKFRQRLHLLVVATVLILAPAAVLAQRPPPRDGSHDFDSEVGTWTIHTKRLMHPLAHANDWVTYDGTKTVTSTRGGKANVAEVKEDGAAGHLNFVALRLYDRDAQQWTLNFMSAGNGTFGVPLAGELRDGGIEFEGPDTLNGRNILVDVGTPLLGVRAERARKRA